MSKINSEDSSLSNTSMPSLRIGHGFDVHSFSEDRKLILGAEEIPSPRGLLGHSDADVLLHGITDAVLGALAWGDIGTWFPDTDPQYNNAASDHLLKTVWLQAVEKGWSLINCDSVILAQEPKLQDYMPVMRRNIASIFSVEAERIGLKASTTEKLGFVGRKEGIAVSSVVLLNGPGK